MNPHRADAPGQPASSPSRWPAQALIAIVHGYRLLLKPWVGNACRFEPTCSAYALQALAAHGAARGSVLSAARVLRCHPWCEGGIDPVPPPGGAGRALFSRLGLGHRRPPDAPLPATSSSSPPAAASGNAP